MDYSPRNHRPQTCSSQPLLPPRNMTQSIHEILKFIIKFHLTIELSCSADLRPVPPDSLAQAPLSERNLTVSSSVLLGCLFSIFSMILLIFSSLPSLCATFLIMPFKLKISFKTKLFYYSNFLVKIYSTFLAPLLIINTVINFILLKL